MHHGSVRVTCTAAWSGNSHKVLRDESHLDSSPGRGRQQCDSTSVLQELRAGLIGSCTPSTNMATRPKPKERQSIGLTGEIARLKHPAPAGGLSLGSR